jgi:hypothetical protein
VNASSKAIYCLAGALLCMNFFLTNHRQWGLAGILAVSASPVFAPNKWNVLLSVCTVLSTGVVGFGLVSGPASRVLSVIAFSSAFATMVLAFSRYLLKGGWPGLRS